MSLTACRCTNVRPTKNIFRPQEEREKKEEKKRPYRYSYAYLRLRQMIIFLSIFLVSSRAHDCIANLSCISFFLPLRLGIWTFVSGIIGLCTLRSLAPPQLPTLGHGIVLHNVLDLHTTYTLFATDRPPC